MKHMTPLDIQHKTFDKKFRGYNPDQVHDFIQEVVSYTEELNKQIKNLQALTETQQKRIGDLEKSEQEIKETMHTAQKMTEQMNVNAKKEAQIIIQQSEIQAEKILKQAHDRLTEIINQINDMKKQKAEFYGGLKGLIEAHLKMLRQDDDADMLVQIEDVGILPKVS